jgi:hypothetical protein
MMSLRSMWERWARSSRSIQGQARILLPGPMAALATEIATLGLRIWRRNNQGNFLPRTLVQHHAFVPSTKASEMQEFDLPLGTAFPPNPRRKECRSTVPLRTSFQSREYRGSVGGCQSTRVRSAMIPPGKQSLVPSECRGGVYTRPLPRRRTGRRQEQDGLLQGGHVRVHRRTFG